MDVKKIEHDKKRFLGLLLLADEQESMIDRYLERGDMFALYDGDLKSVCVVTRESEGVYELKNLATYERYQRRGYGSSLVKYIFEYYKGRCNMMLVGTGDSDLTIPFYERCGFTVSHSIKNFFTDNYDHAMYENGKQLVDMVYLKKDF
jgi:GNAT superfamily N-acetyltransferase